VEAVLSDWHTAEVDPKVRAALALLEKVTLTPEAVSAADVAPLRALGLPRQAVEDALMVCFCFNLIDRLADAFGWHVPGRAGVDASARFLLDKGYLMPFHRT
jgi:alkylhydroperoxidase family enzyme